MLGFRENKEENGSTVHDLADVLEALIDVFWLEMGEYRLRQDKVELFAVEVGKPEVHGGVEQNAWLLV